jgi:hypothetical protein
MAAGQTTVSEWGVKTGATALPSLLACTSFDYSTSHAVHVTLQYKCDCATNMSMGVVKDGKYHIAPRTLISRTETKKSPSHSKPPRSLNAQDLSIGIQGKQRLWHRNTRTFTGVSPF